MPDELADSLENVMLALEDNPRPYGYKKLKGRDAYRLRLRDYRIVYEIEDEIITVRITNVDHRKEITINRQTNKICTIDDLYN